MGLRNRINWYRHDPYIPTPLYQAVWFALADTWHNSSLWFNYHGRPRWFKPSNFDNPLSRYLNRSLFNPNNPGPRNLTIRERILLALGF